MITSKAEFYRSTVSFVNIDIEALDVSKVDVGFFSLFLSSTVVIANNTSFSNLKAQNSAVLNAFSLSNVLISDTVRFTNNSAPDGRTIFLQNTDQIHINDTHFEENYQ